MPLHYVTGDPLLTHAEALAFGYNARGRVELGGVASAIFQRYPTPFAAYAKQCRAQRIKAGTTWLWRDQKPHLMFMVVRESSVGVARLRYVQSVVMKIAREHRLEGYRSLAIAPFVSPLEWREIRPIFDLWLGRLLLPVIVYEVYQPDLRAEESL